MMTFIRFAQRSSAVATAAEKKAPLAIRAFHRRTVLSHEVGHESAGFAADDDKVEVGHVFEGACVVGAERTYRVVDREALPGCGCGPSQTRWLIDVLRGKADENLSLNVV